jgi:hypothetical protein
MPTCDMCKIDINYDEDGGHIYPDGCVVCADCEGAN